MDSVETIFITGGTGYIGKLVLSLLRERAQSANGNLQVVVLTRDPEGFRAKHPELLFPGLRFVKGEIENFSLPSDMRIDWILHGATPSDAPRTEEEARATWNSSFGGTKHLTEVLAARAAAGASPPKHVLYLSSGAIYGAQPSTLPRIPEDYTRAPDQQNSRPGPAAPGDAYGDAKLASEALLQKFSETSGIPMSIARIFACAGPYVPMAGRFALGQFLRSALESGKITIGGDGTPVRSFLDGDELADWLLTILKNPEKMGIYNVGSESELTILEVAEEVKRAFAEKGIDVQIEVQGKAAPVGAGHRYVPSVAKIEEAFGLRPVLSSREAIRKTAHWAIHERSRAIKTK